MSERGSAGPAGPPPDRSAGSVPEPLLSLRGLRKSYGPKPALQGIDIKAMLEQHEDIDSTQTLIVNFNAYGASSLDIMIYTFTKTTVWTTYHHVKQDVLLKIGRIIEQHGAQIAFPTQTLHLHGGAAAPAEPTLPEA